MYEISLITNMTEFLEFTQIVSLMKDQMEYIDTPKTNEEIKETIKLMFETDYAKLMVISEYGRLIGFAFFNVCIGLQSSGRYLWLNEMHIHKSKRGHGHGTILLESLKNYAKENNIHKIMGIVDQVDERTKDFYLKQDADISDEKILSIKI